MCAIFWHERSKISLFGIKVLSLWLGIAIACEGFKQRRNMSTRLMIALHA